MSDSDEPIDHIEEEGDDLFGDDDDVQVKSPKQRVLDDDDLASDPEDDGGRRDYGGYDDAPQETKDRVVMGVTTYRHRIPKPKDGQVRLLSLPIYPTSPVSSAN